MDHLGQKDQKRNYVRYCLEKYKNVQSELDVMEKCEEYMYRNSLNLFSLTIGPFEKASDQLPNANAANENEVTGPSAVGVKRKVIGNQP